MPYASISNLNFNQRYQLLANYIEANKDKTIDDIQQGLNNLPNEHDLKNKNLFVLNQKRKSFLHQAAAKGNLLLIKFLKETGHDINLQDIEHKTPLYDACDQLRLTSVNALLTYGANPNLGTDENFPLIATIESQEKVTAEELMEVTGSNFSNLTEEQATEHTAAFIVKKLIKHNVDINLQTGEEHFSSLHRAIALRKPLIVKELVDSGKANFRLTDRPEGLSALHMVVEYRGKNQKQEEQQQMEQEKQILDLIIPHLESIDIRDAYGNTPLHTAVIGSNPEVVEALCKKDYLFSQLKLLSIQNDEGNTAIHEAVKEARRGPKVLKILLRLATVDDLAIVNNDVETALQMAERLIDEAKKVNKLVNDIYSKAGELTFLMGEESVSLEKSVVDFQEFNELDIVPSIHYEIVSISI